MHLRHDPRPPEELLVALHEELARLVVETRLGEGHDQQTADDLKDVLEGGLREIVKVSNQTSKQGLLTHLGCPVLLQSINADLPTGRY